jgi:hypothetical protein
MTWTQPRAGLLATLRPVRPAPSHYQAAMR